MTQIRPSWQDHWKAVLPVMSRKDLEDESESEKSNALEFRPLCPWQILSMEQTEDPASLTMDDMKLDETSDPDLFFFCLHDRRRSKCI